MYGAGDSSDGGILPISTSVEEDEDDVLFGEGWAKEAVVTPESNDFGVCRDAILSVF